jgi:hypothetical protein
LKYSRNGSTTARLRFVREQGDDDPGTHDRGHHEVHRLPRHEGGKVDRERPGHEEGDPVSPDVEARAQAQLLVAQDLAPVGVDHDVLRRTEERDEHGEERDHPGVHLGPRGREAQEREDQRGLREQKPALAASQERRNVPVQERRPHELESVRDSNEREEADRLEVDLHVVHPDGEGPAREQEREPGDESQEKVDQHPLAADDLEQRLFLHSASR